MPTIQEIKREYGEMQTKLINQSFELGAASQHHEGQMSPELEEKLGTAEVEKIRAAEAAMWTENVRDRLRTRYEELDLERRAAIELRVEAIERELSPGEVNFGDRLAASAASPEALITAMDSALTSGDEDAALLAFQIARQRDLEEVVAHAVTADETWGDLYGELAEAAEDPELSPGDRFEMFAKPAPTKEAILAAPLDDRNIYGMMR
jgi:predicted nuclease with TOPRIM domain